MFSFLQKEKECYAKTIGIIYFISLRVDYSLLILRQFIFKISIISPFLLFPSFYGTVFLFEEEYY